MGSNNDNQWGVGVEIQGQPTHILFTPEAFTVLHPDLATERVRFREVIQAVVGFCMSAPRQEHQPFTVPLRNVLWAELVDDISLTIVVLAKTRKNKYRLIQYDGVVTSDKTQAQEWVLRLMKLAYDGELFKIRVIRSLTCLV